MRGRKIPGYAASGITLANHRAAIGAVRPCLVGSTCKVQYVWACHRPRAWSVAVAMYRLCTCAHERRACIGARISMYSVPTATTATNRRPRYVTTQDPGTSAHRERKVTPPNSQPFTFHLSTLHSSLSFSPSVSLRLLICPLPAISVISGLVHLHAPTDCLIESTSESNKTRGFCPPPFNGCLHKLRFD